MRDLYERLQLPLEAAGISLSMKTGDTGPVDAQHAPSVLLTTPESTDALLTRAPRLFADLQAIVLDEIHVLDNTPRGDQLRSLLTRLDRIVQFARPDCNPAQRIALSATITDPDGVAQRYLQNGIVVDVPGGRSVAAEIKPLYDMIELVTALAKRARLKSLIFCNSREEVERTAAYLRQHLPYYAEIFVHYSNLDGAMRRDVEERFASASVAVCVTTSTLELGIDIGSVDDVVLLGVPPDPASFVQRTGRGERRSEQARVLCLPKSPGEQARFEALQFLATEQDASLEDVRVYGYRPSVLIQQTFSLIKQAPTGTIRLADVRRLAPAEISDEQVRQIISELTMHRYLKAGRLGEWKPDTELQLLFDRHGIYSNIGVTLMAATAVDAYTGRVIAQTERVYDKGSVVMFGGRPMKVIWRDNYRFGLAPVQQADVNEVLDYRKTYAVIPFIVTQTVARLVGIEPPQIVVVPQNQGQWLFHFWGTVWGKLLTAVLRSYKLQVDSVNEYCLHLGQPLNQLPAWDEEVGQAAARRTAVALTDRLEMGRFHKLLPANVAVAAAVGQLNLVRFMQIYKTATITSRADINEQLDLLVD